MHEWLITISEFAITCPGRASVCAPPFTTAAPLTNTCVTPVA